MSNTAVPFGLESRRRGLMLVLSSPSGAGKTTISRRILGQDPNIDMSVSITTRPMRQGETDGVDYRFVDREKFDAMVAGEELLEHATVFDNRYGTPRATVEAALGGGKDILFDIDWQGTQQLRDKMRADLASIFILPPSVRELHDRLKKRARDPEEVVNRRMAKAIDEMSHWAEYDYVVVNRDVEESVGHVQAILTAERHRRERRIGIADFVRGLSRG